MKLELGKIDLVFASIVWLVLLSSFFINFFGVGTSQSWFEDFQKDSSLIIEKTAICKGRLHYNGPVIASIGHEKDMTSEDCTSSNYIPYDSQFGLQSRIIALFAPGQQHIESYFRALELILSAMTAFILTAIIMRIKRLFGRIPAVTTTGLVALSVWVVGYARNLYWVEPLMFAPFAVSFVAYSWFKRTGRLWLFYGVEALLVFAKLLDGYEHLTTISLSIFVPIIFYELLMTKDRRILDLWKQALVVIAITVVAFISALACNVVVLSSYYGSPTEAIQHIQRRSEARSLAGVENTKKDVILNFEATLPAVYQAVNDRVMDLEALKNGHEPLVKYIGILALNYLLLPAITLPVPVNGMFGVLLQSIVLWSVFGYMAIRLLKRSIRFKQYYRALHWTYWASLTGALSWLILMPGHAFPHAHLNGIIFYIPHLLFCYLAIGLVITDRIADRRAMKGKK